MAELRCYVFLDRLQPKFASFLGTVSQGFLPTPGEAALFVEINPGMDIMRMTDVALKATSVTPGMLNQNPIHVTLNFRSAASLPATSVQQCFAPRNALSARRRVSSFTSGPR